MWGGKGSGRGENLGGHEVFAPLNDAGLFFNLPFVVRHRQNGAEPREAGAEAWLGITGVAMSRECGRCRLAPASAP
jgi:hypothetical protein